MHIYYRKCKWCAAMQGPCAAISWNARMDFDLQATAVIICVVSWHSILFETARKMNEADIYFCATLFFTPPGAMIKLTVDDKIFTKSALDRLVLSMLEEDAIASGLMSYSYRTAVNILHLTVVDNTTNEKSIALAQKLYTYLMKGERPSSFIHSFFFYQRGCYIILLHR